MVKLHCHFNKNVGHIYKNNEYKNVTCIFALLVSDEILVTMSTTRA